MQTLKTIAAKSWFRWSLTLVFLGLAAYQIDPSDVSRVTSSDSAVLLLQVALALVFVVMLNTLRWIVVARVLGLNLEPVAALRYTFIGHFFNQLVPSSIGGDVARGLLAIRDTGDVARVATSITLERLVGFLALLTFIAIGQPLLMARVNDVTMTELAAVAVVAGLGLVIAPFVADKIIGRFLPERLNRALVRLGYDARLLLSSPLLSLFALLIAFVMHACNLLLLAAISNHLGAGVTAIDMLLVVPTILLIASLPISIGGWGVRESGLAVAFSAIGFPASIGVLASVFLGLANLISALPGALAWAMLPAASSDIGSTRQSAGNA